MSAFALMRVLAILAILMLAIGRFSGQRHWQNGCCHHDGQCYRKKLQAQISFEWF
jgi:hypothetical protein